MSLTTRQKGVGLAAAVVAAGLLTAGGIWMFSGGSQLVTYPIAPEAEALRNTAYRIEARPLRGEWRELDVYNVKIDPDFQQNSSDDDPVIDSPMVLFDFTGGVQVRVRRADGGPIASAQAHPASKKLPLKMEDGTAVLTLRQPGKVTLSLDGDRQRMVYIMAGTPEEAPAPDDPNVVRLGPGVHTFPETGTEGMKGGIRDAAVYTRALTAGELEGYGRGELPEGPDAWWPLAEDFADKAGDKDGRPVGNPSIAADYGPPALCLDGHDDAVPTGYALQTGENAYTLTARIYLDPARPGVESVVFSGLLAVRSDGVLYTNLGSWEYPFFSTDKVPMGAWTDVALVKQGMELTFYINGRAAGTEQRALPKTAASLLLGAGGVSHDFCLMDNQTLYLEPGAVVKGRILAYGVKNAAVRGRGIIWQSPGQSIVSLYAENLRVEGITILDPRSMCSHLCESDGVTFTDVRMFSRLGATDGVHIKASRNVAVEDCFIRSNDDCIAVYASFTHYTGNAENIAVRRCTLINDAAHAIYGGIHAAPGGQDVIRGLTFEDIDVLDSKAGYSDYQGVLALNAANDVTIDTVLFSDIRVEDFQKNQLFNLRVWNNPDYCKSSGRAIRNVTFRDIAYTGDNALMSVIHGDGPERQVEGVTFERVVLNGRRVTGPGSDFLIGNYTKDIRFQ